MFIELTVNKQRILYNIDWIVSISREVKDEARKNRANLYVCWDNFTSGKITTFIVHADELYEHVCFILSSGDKIIIPDSLVRSTRKLGETDK